MENVLNIKNMVCNRCIKVVKEEISKLGFQIKNIELGKVELSKVPNKAETQTIKQVLLENGFELIDDKKSRIIDEIQTVIIELVHYKERYEYSHEPEEIISNFSNFENADNDFEPICLKENSGK